MPRAALHGPGVALVPLSNGAGTLSPELLNASARSMQLVIAALVDDEFVHTALQLAKSANLAPPPAPLSAAVSN